MFRYSILLILICITINFLEAYSYISISFIIYFNIDYKINLNFLKKKNQNFTKYSYVTFL